MLTLVAFLVILMGLMVSLARYVRTRSADRLTRNILQQVDTLVRHYEARNGHPPAVQSVVTTTGPVVAEVDVAAAASVNSRALVRALRSGTGEASSIAGHVDAGGVLRDAWDSPVVYMAQQHPAIGMAAEDRPFCFSAGPDHQYLTRGDNLYSYEAADAPEPVTVAKP